MVEGDDRCQIDGHNRKGKGKEGVGRGLDQRGGMIIYRGEERQIPQSWTRLAEGKVLE